MALQDHKPLAELPPDPSEDLLQRAAEEAARDLALQAESNNKTNLLEALSQLSNLFRHWSIWYDLILDKSSLIYIL